MTIIDNALKNALLSMTLITVTLYGYTTITPALGQQAYNISILGTGYDPDSLFISAGSTVTWTNNDQSKHTATCVICPTRFDSLPLEKKGTFSFIFNTPGTYQYFDKLNPAHIGRIVVT